MAKDMEGHSLSRVKAHVNRYLVYLLALTGCATMVDIDYSVSPPADWPVLEERITYADKETVQRWCNMPKAIRDRVFNCAVLSFRYGLCMIYLSTDDPAALKHERAHCAGYAHVGDSRATHRAWDKFKKDQKLELLPQ